MSYYTVLGLRKEPFSSSPDPEFFYDSYEHRAALMRLLVEIRLRRGLNLILGDVGTGKTTLSRKLFQMLKERADILFYMIMDPTPASEELFWESLIRTFNISEAINEDSGILDYKEAIKKFLFQRGVEENKTIVLVIDEAQKLDPSSLEVLRVLLNYETNEYKLLQLVLLSQMELLPIIKGINNFYDRIILKYVLNPFDEQETKDMIEFRLKQAGFSSDLQLFTDRAISEIYHHSQGYPRKINWLCHNALRSLLAEDRTVVDEGLVREVITRGMI
ncbi:MAG: AAA family ATPase [Candidatus Omnitrophica bacterium]|nr:AAA family ATPase [Candidatus Omnitrophota bacterium]